MEYHHGASIGDCGAHWSLYAVGDTVGISPSGVDAYQALRSGALVSIPLLELAYPQVTTTGAHPL